MIRKFLLKIASSGKFNRYAQYYLSWRYMNANQIIQYNINPRFLPILHMWFKLGNLFSEKFPWWIIILWRRPASFATAQSDQHLNCTCCTLYQISPIQASLIENWSKTVQNYCCISFFCAVPKKENAAKHWRRATRLSGPLTQACHKFFVKKPKIFENVKSERAAANFQKSRTLHASTIISKNSQI